MFTKAALRAGLAFAMIGWVSSAGAVTFNLTDTGGAGAGTAARAGFDAAARYWSSVLTDNVTVNLNIGFTSLGGNILGQTSSSSKVVSVQNEYAALSADQTSALDAIAVANLQPTTPGTSGYGAVSAVVNAYSSSARNRYTDAATRIDSDGSTNNIAVALTTANAKALGFTRDINNSPINYGAADGSITFSSDYAFDFNPTDGVSAGAYDFIGIAIHEIGHALGFTSGVDTYDYYTGSAPGGSLPTGGLDGTAVATGLDLFRYSAANTLDWSTSSATKYFSIDGGKTQLFGDSAFSLGAYNGDGHQASHWEDAASEAQRGIMDPTSAPGQMMALTALDLAAYDAIGWNLNLDILANPNYTYTTADAYAAYSAAPELATWLEMVGGFGMIGAAVRRVRRSQPLSA